MHDECSVRVEPRQRSNAAVARLWRGMVIGLVLEVSVGAVGFVATEGLMSFHRGALHESLVLTKRAAVITLGVAG
jgi:hypothetical protein